MGEASRGEPASRSASELESASLHKVRVASLPEKLKPAIDREATGASTDRTFRGEWRQRAGTERPRNLGDPAQRDELCVGGRAERHNRIGGGCGRESDRLIVARKRVTTVERRGRSHCELLSEEG